MDFVASSFKHISQGIYKLEAHVSSSFGAVWVKCIHLGAAQKLVVIKKGKGFPYSLLSVVPRADPGVHAVRTLSHPPGIGCHYSPPDLRYLPSHRASPPLGRYQVILLSDRDT